MTHPDILLVAIGPDGGDPNLWVAALGEQTSGFTVQALGAAPVDPDWVRYIAAWKHPAGSLKGFPHLKAIFSLGAGVDHLLTDHDLPDGVPIIRVVDPDLTNRMSEWVLLHTLVHHRQMRLYDWQQSEKIWADDAFQPAAKDVRVGVMGLGVLGADAAKKLSVMGFDVAGWSRTPKALPDIETYAGEAELPTFLARTQILVVLLPLTLDTRGILSRPLFEGLARDSYFGGPILLNAGRGGLQKADDILAALDDGTLKAVTLDVFEQEPLPADSPLWHHPAVTITPHNAAISNADTIAGFIAGEITKLEAGETSAHTIDPKRSY